jgi:hypothetical protein
MNKRRNKQGNNESREVLIQGRFIQQETLLFSTTLEGPWN